MGWGRGAVVRGHLSQHPVWGAPVLLRVELGGDPGGTPFGTLKMGNWI